MAFVKNNQNFRFKSDNKREQQPKGYYSQTVDKASETRQNIINRIMPPI